MSVADDALQGETLDSMADAETTDDENRTRRVAAIVGVILLALLLWWIISRLAIVPDVVGLSEAQATQAIETAGFVVGEVTRAASDDADAGTVSNQAPDGGTRKLKGSAISLVISTGSGDGAGRGGDGDSSADGSGLFDADLTLPDTDDEGTPDYVPASPPALGNRMFSVMGMTESDARSALARAGYAVTVDYGPTTAGIPGRVYYQNPTAEDFVAAGIRVNIWISTGAPEEGFPYPQPPYAGE